MLVTENSASEAEPFLEVLRRRYLPNKVVVLVVGSDEAARLAASVPYVEGKIPRGGRPTAYVCERFVCQLPTTDPAVFATQLGLGPE